MTKALKESRFLSACRGQSVDRTPVWMMRQAGRYMKVYRDVKERAGGFFELCRNPELSAQATLDAQAYLDTDAAIIFSDITLPGWAMGMPLDFDPGPKYTTPIRSEADLAKLQSFDPHDKLGFVMRAIGITREKLPADCSLIGFVGAPLTLAGYMIEGYPGKNWVEFKRMLYGNPELMHAVLDKVADGVAAHAQAQAEAGCDTLQLFDTLAGDLSSAELHTFAFAYAKKVIDKLKPLGVPIIYFARSIGAHLEAAADLGADVIGVDWTVSLTDARRRIGDKVALMGNLDPTVLFTEKENVIARTQEVLEQAKGLDGYVFNLGHGILPNTPPENAKAIVETVHARTR